MGPSASRVVRHFLAREEWAYHATFLSRLDGISSGGLRPSGGSQFGGGYSGHSRGRVFLSGKRGLRFWMNKMEDIARHSSDFDEPESLGWTPVALRVRVRDLPLEVDELGKKDSFADAWFVGARIPSEDIEVWNGSRWVPVRSANSSEMLEAAQEAAEWESEDGEPYDEWGDNDGWFEPNFELFHP